MIGVTIGGRGARGLSRVVVAVLAMVLVGGCGTPKPPSAFEQAFDDDTKPWTEIATQLPPPPDPASLVRFSVSGGTQYTFAIDAKSLDIGSDGVFRYTLVATSPQGARNVSYEGIRCDTAQKKIYAIGRDDGTWVRARNAQWSPIENLDVNRQHAALQREYFCPDGYAARKPGDVIARMKPIIPPSEAQFDTQTRGQERR